MENNFGNELLRDERLSGAIDSISDIANFIMDKFQWFISMIGLFIVVAATAKNTIAGLYCIFPKFFDKVHAAHLEVEDQGWIERIKGFGTSYSQVNAKSFKNMFYRICPDVITWTDFESGTVDPKAYFVKAIPLFVLSIILGGCIYNGITAQLGAKITDVGTVLFNRLMTATDPISLVDRVFNMTGWPEFTVASSSQGHYKLIYDVSSEARSIISTKYPDISGDTNKSYITSMVENLVTDFVNTKVDTISPAELADMTSGDVRWTYTITVGSTVNADMTLRNRGQYDEDNAVFAYSFNVEKELQLRTNNRTQNVDNDTLDIYMEIALKRRLSTPVNTNEIAKTKQNNLVLVAYPTGSGKTYTLLNVSSGSTTTASTSVVLSSVLQCTYEGISGSLSKSNGGIKIVFDSNPTLETGKVITLDSTQFYYYDVENNHQHNITSIIIAPATTTTPYIQGVAGKFADTPVNKPLQWYETVDEVPVATPIVTN